MTLKKYYASKHWRTFRLSLTQPEDCQCQICGLNRWERYKKKPGFKKPKRIHIHHKNYDCLGKEKRSDVLILCGPCHDYGHATEMLSRTRGGIYKTIYDLYKLNTQWQYKKRAK